MPLWNYSLLIALCLSSCFHTGCEASKNKDPIGSLSHVANLLPMNNGRSSNGQAQGLSSFLNGISQMMNKQVKESGQNFDYGQFVRLADQTQAFMPKDLHETDTRKSELYPDALIKMSNPARPMDYKTLMKLSEPTERLELNAMIPSSQTMQKSLVVPAMMEQFSRHQVDTRSMQHLAGDSQLQDPSTSLHFRPVQLNSRTSQNGVLSVSVESKTLNDLMADEEGRQQLKQVDAQLQQAMLSMRQGVHMTHDIDEAKEVVDNLGHINKGDLLGNVEEMLTGAQSTGASQLMDQMQSLKSLGRFLDSFNLDESLHEVMGQLQSLQSMDSLLTSLDRLPTLNGIFTQASRLLDKMLRQESGTASDLQQLLGYFVNALKSPETHGGQSLSGMEGIMEYLNSALEGINANMEILEKTANDLQKMMNSPSFLPLMKDTHCVMKTLAGRQPAEPSLMCLTDLLQMMTADAHSEQSMVALRDALRNLLLKPTLLQSLTALVEQPSLNKVFVLLHSVVGNMTAANEDLTTALDMIQSVQTGIESLFANEQMAQVLNGLLHNPRTEALYHVAMETLMNSTGADSSSTGQLLILVNDTVDWLRRDEDFKQAALRLKSLLIQLGRDLDSRRPLGQVKRDLLHLMTQLLDLTLDIAANSSKPAGGEVTTYLPPTVAKPTTAVTTSSSTTTVGVETTDSPRRTTTTAAPTTTQAERSNASISTKPSPTGVTNTRSSTPSSTAVGQTRTPTTRGSDDTVDNGALPVSVSAAFYSFTVVVALSVVNILL